MEYLLSQATGYGLVCGLSVAFALIIIFAVRLQKRYLFEDSDQSEMFMVANRSVGTGLTCSAVFSSWMWINESVFSASFTYKWGVALPVWWATGLSFQIALMALLGIVAKLRVPYAHTSLEIIRQRYGGYAHITFIVLNLINNIFGCAQMILSGAQLVTGMTGMNVVAACILIPAGVVLYTAVGGLKATFLTDFVHTTIALILLLYFSIGVLSNEHIGGPIGLYDKVKAANWYIEGNYKGSLLTFKSKPAVLFGLVVKLGNLALVVMDTAFWQKSFASKVESTVPAYELASITILAIPWCAGTIIGLAGRAIEKTPIWYTYPTPLTEYDVDTGLVMPYVLRSLLGPGATTGLLVLIFMAITSTVSSSMIAVSSIIALDGYRTYINPRATDRKTLQVSHGGVLFHGCFMAGFAIMLEYAGATLYWSTYFRPVVTCSGILPLVLALFWSRQTKAAAIIAPILGMSCGLATWLSLSWYWGGTITIQTTQLQLPGVYGATVSFFSPAIFSVIISLLWPHKFDWRIFLQISLIEDKTTSPPSGLVTSIAVHGTPEALKAEAKTADGKDVAQSDAAIETSLNVSGNSSQTDLDNVVHPFADETIRHIRRWLKFAAAFFVVNVLVTCILWPVPLYRDWIASPSFFYGHVIVGILWQFGALFAAVIYPVYDGRADLIKTVKGLLGK